MERNAVIFPFLSARTNRLQSSVFQGSSLAADTTVASPFLIKASVARRSAFRDKDINSCLCIA